MNLYQLLTHIPHDHLQRLAEEFGLAFTPSKRNLLQAINARYRDVDFMRDLALELPYECRGLLRALTYFTEGENVTITPLLATAWVSENDLLENAQRIGASGLVFPQDFRDTRRVLLPFELRALLREIFKPTLTSHQSDSVPAPTSRRSVGVEAIFQLLCVLQHLRARKTQKGVLHRKIVELWSVRVGEPKPDEPCCQFALNYALRRGLVEERDDEFQLTPSAQEWTSRPTSALQSDIWNDLLETRVLPDRRMQAFLAWLAALADAAGEGNETRGWLLDEARNFQFECFPEEETLSDIDFSCEAFRLLNQAGLLALDDFHEPKRFGLTPEGARLLLHREEESDQTLEEGVCVAQPNFELLIPPSVGYETLWRIDQIAEFVRRDVMTEYRITQGSILTAMRSGWSAEAIIRFVERITGGRIPDLVAFSLKEWCAKYGRVRLRRTVVMECDSPELAEEILHVPNASGLIRERISPSHFLVEEDDAKALFRLLRERGYEPSSVGFSNGDNSRIKS